MNPQELPELERAALFARLASFAPSAAPELVVLCASRRLAQHFQDAYARWQAQRGVSAWASPAILTADAFLQDLAERERLRMRRAGSALPTPLSQAESDLLWRLVVSENRGAATLLREADAAQLAADAWRLCQDYGIALPLAGGSADVERFNEWAQLYRARCERLQRLDAGVYRSALLDLLGSGQLMRPAAVVLAGFDDAMPWQRRLFATLGTTGTELLRLRERNIPGRVRAGVAAGGEQELRAAARWVHDVARERPQARIGIIVPDLGARRADVQRVFDQTLCPALEGLAGGRGERPYNLTLGDGLSQVGLVQCALSLLRLCVEGLELSEAGALMCAPYWGGAAHEQLLRADLDRVLRDEGHLRVGLPVLRRLAWRDADLQARLQRMAELRGARANADTGEWAERFSAWLDAAGWPGPRTLDSGEYQAMQAWRELLRELGGVAGVLGPVAASAALAQLQRLAQQRVFQPQTPPVHVHVLGALEAQGLDFDALWVMGLDDERWPPAGRPNPFIPFELQRRLGLPHASTGQELAWAKRMTARWRCAADDVVFSWPATAEDRPLSPSPLIHPEAAFAETLAIDAINPVWRDARAAAREQRLADAYAPAPDAERTVPGGARLLGDQARCPFRAFATHRLGAGTLQAPGYGPSYIDRGQLVHRALEALWRDWREQSALLALDEAMLDARIAEVVETELDRMAHDALQRFPAGLRRLESERLCRLLREWVALERKRPPFSVELIEGRAPEQIGDADRDDQVVRFGGLLLRLRPDRVDRLADGQRLVLDYKTGARKPLPWHDGRPEEPQLLLYGLSRQDVAGVAYARLTVGSIGFDGIAADAELAPGLKRYDEYRETREASDWTALLGRWRGELETLAGEVRRGLASVTPKHPRQSCRDCHLRAACRIHELQPASFEDEGDGE